MTDKTSLFAIDPCAGVSQLILATTDTQSYRITEQEFAEVISVYISHHYPEVEELNCHYHIFSHLTFMLIELRDPQLRCPIGKEVTMEFCEEHTIELVHPTIVAGCCMEAQLKPHGWAASIRTFPMWLSDVIAEILCEDVKLADIQPATGTTYPTPEDTDMPPSYIAHFISYPTQH